jgi:tetratricopeptide (TPR) repeat protein
MGRKRQPHPRKAEQARPSTGFSFSRNWVLGLILGFTFLAFSNSIFNDFAYDDQTQIIGNELIRDFSNLPTAFTKEVWFFRYLQDQDPNKQAGPTTPYYRPMFTVYLMVVWNLFGAWPQPWHLLNVLMHLVAVYFAFLILEKITGDFRVSGIATLLFAVHPLRVESVAWISGVTDLFLAVFLLPSFYLYMLFREGGSILRQLLLLAASLALFLVAAFSKEPAVALPIFIVAYEVFIINRGKTFQSRFLWGALFGFIFFGMSVVYFLMRYKALGFVFHHGEYTKHPFDAVLLTIPLAICKYLALLIWPFWPVKLSLFHATYLVRSPLSPRFILPLLVVLAIAFALWKLRSSLAARFAALWFAIHLLPVLNLSAFAEDFMVQERYVYIPSIGFSLLVALALVHLPYERLFSSYTRVQVQKAVVVILVLAMGLTTFSQNTVWADDQTLWEYGVEAAPEQTMPHYILGHKSIVRNDQLAVVENLENYMKLDQNNPVVVSNLAAAHLFAYEMTNDRTHIDRSIALSEKGLKLTDKYAPLWDTLGRAYTFNTELKNYARAHSFFDRALKLQPENAMINFHKGATYALEQKLDPAVEYLENARRLEPDLPDVHKFLGYTYRARRQNQEALNSFNTYLRLMPDAQEDQEVRKVIEELQAQARTASPQS